MPVNTIAIPASSAQGGQLFVTTPFSDSANTFDVANHSLRIPQGMIGENASVLLGSESPLPRRSGPTDVKPCRGRDDMLVCRTAAQNRDADSIGTHVQ